MGVFSDFEREKNTLMPRILRGLWMHTGEDVHEFNSSLERSITG